MKTFKELLAALPEDLTHDPQFKAVDRALSMDTNKQLQTEWSKGNLDKIINLLNSRLDSKRDVKLAFDYMRNHVSN